MNRPLPPEKFHSTLVSWGQTHGRNDLPWQIEPTPYGVHVSEIMLQQTQVKTVIPYYQKWMTRFPTIEALSIADEDTVMHLWQGLGYYSRARNLQKAAQYLIHEFLGHYPRTLKQLEMIPGVGQYTAGAIVSFAYNKPGPIVDGNVRRLFCRYFAIEGISSSSAVNRQLWDYARTYTLEHDCRIFAQSLLDMGALICRAKNPLCELCPLQANCQAFQQNRVNELPTPKPKKNIPIKIGLFYWQTKKNKIYLAKRPAPGIWAGLWCLPQADHHQVNEPSHVVGTFKHVFSHYKLDAQVISPSQIVDDEEGRYFSASELQELGLPTPIRQFIAQHWELYQ